MGFCLLCRRNQENAVQFTMDHTEGPLKMTTQKIAIVTGGSSGIGAAAVKKLIEKNIRTFVLDKDPCAIDQALVTSFECDVSDFTAVENTFKKITEQTNRVDHLILNAGIYYYGTITETPPEDVSRVIDINLKGVIHCLQATLPIMVKQSGGTIVITGSDQSTIGKKNNSLYGATKGALGQITKSTALDFADKNIRVNCVCPGAIKTPLYDRAVKHAADRYFSGSIEAVEKLVREKHPLGRVGTPEEVANLIWFLSSDESSFITGALIPIDGGYTAQ